MDIAALPVFAMRLYRLDLLIEREILRLRGRYQLSLDEFRGLYVSDKQVDELLNQHRAPEGDIDYIDRLSHEASMLRDVTEQGADPLQQLAQRFSLNAIECDLLFLALAPELDLKYETLYAYLNDDVSRKWPTLQMAQRLLDEREAIGNAARMALAPSATLVRERLIQLGDTSAALRSTTHQGFSLEPAVAHFLLGLSPGNPALGKCTARSATGMDWLDVPVIQTLRDTLRRLPIVFAQNSSPIAIFSGETGSGKAQATEALATTMALPLLAFDLTAVSGNGDATAMLDPLAIELKLWPALLQIVGIESLNDSEGRPSSHAAALARWLRAWHGPVVLDVPSGFHWRRMLPELRGIQLDFDQGGYAQRASLWRSMPTQRGIELTADESAALATRFAFSAGQIEAALADATDMATLQADAIDRQVNFSSILSSARAASDQHLGSLATKVRHTQGWDDLVLPAHTMSHLRDFAAAVRQRHVVFAEWGFAQRLGHTGSLVAMFAGVSGTGKTMSAGVIAGELDIDLYKVDLSGLVSKYIGETEKNLDRVFDVARKANAMLFFDEADALFGKRSEVKDAHDRYANIEVAYLLQKMEEHPGVVILATNAKRNIDEAFSRRLQFVIEFQIPDQRERERLWRGMFPKAAPVQDDIDFEFLAKQFSLCGGHIRNVVLDAAFLSAQAGSAIDMRQIIQALARQFAKQGKIASPSEFRQYHAMISREAGAVL